MIICERLYRAVRERELKGISSVKPDVFNEIYDFKYYLDAMYSHVIPSHTLHKNIGNTRKTGYFWAKRSKQLL